MLVDVKSLAKRSVFKSFLKLPEVEGHSVERTYLRQRCFDGSMNKTIVKPCIAAAVNTYTSDFPDVKFRVAALIR